MSAEVPGERAVVWGPQAPPSTLPRMAASWGESQKPGDTVDVNLGEMQISVHSRACAWCSRLTTVRVSVHSWACAWCSRLTTVCVSVCTVTRLPWKALCSEEPHMRSRDVGPLT